MVDYVPYCLMSQQVGDGPKQRLSLGEYSEKANTNKFRAAFVLAGRNDGPAWGGSEDVKGSKITKEIKNFDGDVVVSFGGAQGPYLSKRADNPNQLVKWLKTVIDETGCNYLDFDDEQTIKSVAQKRGKALAKLQKDRDVKISFTLAASVRGLQSGGTKMVVQKALDEGVEVDAVNMMTMDYGWKPPNMETIKSTINSLHGQIQDMMGVDEKEAWSRVGITPMLGKQDTGGTFHLSTAKKLHEWASDKGVGFLSCWCVNRDNGTGTGGVNAHCSGVNQEPFEFSQNLAGDGGGGGGGGGGGDEPTPADASTHYTVKKDKKKASAGSNYATGKEKSPDPKPQPKKLVDNFSSGSLASYQTLKAKDAPQDETNTYYPAVNTEKSIGVGYNVFGDLCPVTGDEEGYAGLILNAVDVSNYYMGILDATKGAIKILKVEGDEVSTVGGKSVEVSEGEYSTMKAEVKDGELSIHVGEHSVSSDVETFSEGDKVGFVASRRSRVDNIQEQKRA